MTIQFEMSASTRCSSKMTQPLSTLYSLLSTLYYHFSSFITTTSTMSSPLTSGFCQTAFTDENANKSEPIVQVLSVKKINAAGQSGQDRFRSVILSRVRQNLADGSDLSCPMVCTLYSPCWPLSSIALWRINHSTRT